jgi:hypothetical protein
MRHRAGGFQGNHEAGPRAPKAAARPQDGRGGPEGRVRRVPEGARASDGACRRGGSDQGQGSQKKAGRGTWATTRGQQGP